MKKVMIVIFTDGRLPRKVYKRVINQDYPNFEVMIYVRKSDPNLSSTENQVINMNYVREMCKNSTADYFWFVDSDLLVKKNHLSSLMIQLEQPQYDPELVRGMIQEYAIKYNLTYDEAVKKTTPEKKHIIGGYYLLSPKLPRWQMIWHILFYKKGQKILTLPEIYEYRLTHKFIDTLRYLLKLDKRLMSRPPYWSPGRFVATNTFYSSSCIEPSVVNVDKIASGCILMSREVMEKFKWRKDHIDLNYAFDSKGEPIRAIDANGKEIQLHRTACRCIQFAIDAEMAGYSLWADGSVVCKHLSVPHNKLEELIFWLKKKVRHQC
jgi:hypothetical protein